MLSYHLSSSQRQEGELPCFALCWVSTRLGGHRQGQEQEAKDFKKPSHVYKVCRVSARLSPVVAEQSQASKFEVLYSSFYVFPNHTLFKAESALGAGKTRPAVTTILSQTLRPSPLANLRKEPGYFDRIGKPGPQLPAVSACRGPSSRAPGNIEY